MKHLQLFILFTILSFGVHSKKFSETIIMIQPVSWDELQLLQLDALKAAEDLKLSDQCPNELAAFEYLDAQSTFFKEILWTKYFWTEFTNNEGNICIVKHDTIDFFSTHENSSPIKTPKYEILNQKQAIILLNAADSIGFDEIGIETLKHHVHFHNQAVQDAPFAKYGGLQAMMRFVMRNPRETAYKPSNGEERKFVDKNGVVSYKTLNPIDVFESKYSEKTLAGLAKKVQDEKDLNVQKSTYPFNSFEGLLEQSQIDLEIKKKAL